MEKTGRDTSLPKLDPHDEESPAYWGNILEPIVATHYSKRSGHRVRRINAVLQHPDPKLPWMLANIDREVIGAEDVQILECKTAGINGARLWKEGVPEYVQLQVMHQLAVTGKPSSWMRPGKPLALTKPPWIRRLVRALTTARLKTARKTPASSSRSFFPPLRPCTPTQNSNRQHLQKHHWPKSWNRKPADTLGPASSKRAPQSPRIRTGRPS